MNVIVTGCSKGIGLEITQSFLRYPNVRVIGLSRTSVSLMSKNFHHIPFDLLNLLTEANVLIKEINKIVHSVDILINNAGFLRNERFENTSYEEAFQMVQANFISPALLIQSLLPLLQKSFHAHIVNIGSMGGVQGSVKYEGLSWYSSSKAALATLTECLALEFSKYNISINCLALGAVDTQMLQEAFPEYRAPVKPEEIAPFITHFALNAHKFINGKIIPLALSNP